MISQEHFILASLLASVLNLRPAVLWWFFFRDFISDFIVWVYDVASLVPPTGRCEQYFLVLVLLAFPGTS